MKFKAAYNLIKANPDKNWYVKGSIVQDVEAILDECSSLGFIRAMVDDDVYEAVCTIAYELYIHSPFRLKSAPEALDFTPYDVVDHVLKLSEQNYEHYAKKWTPKMDLPQAHFKNIVTKQAYRIQNEKQVLFDAFIDLCKNYKIPVDDNIVDVDEEFNEVLDALRKRNDETEELIKECLDA